MTSKIKYLTQRGDTLFFRRRVPPALQGLAGRHEWKIAIGPKSSDQQMLMIELRTFTEATDKAVARLKRGQRVQSDLLEQARLELYPSAQLELDPDWIEVEAIFLRSKNISSLGKAEAMAIAQFRELFPDTKLTEVTRKNVRHWIDWLRDHREQASSTTRRRVGSMAAIYSRVVDALDMDRDNPFHGFRFEAAGGAYRLPFHTSHLQKLDHWLKSSRRNSETGLLLRLLRLTGARPLEIGGLTKEDIVKSNGLLLLQIQPNSVRRLKTQSSTRTIPLIGDARTSAMTLLERTEAGPLFSAKCHETGSLSARLNKALRAAGIPKSSRLTAYSFRHTFEEALRLSDVSFDVQQALMGHAPASMTDRYGAKRISIARLAEAISIAECNLGGADLSNYQLEELE